MKLLAITGLLALALKADIVEIHKNTKEVIEKVKNLRKEESEGSSSSEMKSGNEEGWKEVSEGDSSKSDQKKEE